jgi:hypothetical protein
MPRDRRVRINSVQRSELTPQTSKGGGKVIPASDVEHAAMSLRRLPEQPRKRSFKRGAFGK